MKQNSRSALCRQLQMARGLFWGFGLNGDPYAMLLCGHDDDPGRWYGQLASAGGTWRSRTGAWVVTDHALADEALDDPRLTRKDGIAPDWTRAAGCVTAEWTRWFSAAWAENTAVVRPDEQWLHDSCRRLLDELGPRFDLVRDFAREVPIAAITGVFDLDTATARTVRDCARSCVPVLDANFSPQDVATTVESVTALDVIGGLPDGAKMRPLIALAAEMTANTVVNAVMAAMSNPGLIPKFSDDPTFADRVLAEVVRLTPPAHLERRCASEDLELGGAEISGGGEVVIAVGAANRDADVFANPHEFDPDRPADQKVLTARGRADGIDEFVTTSAAIALRAIAPVLDRLSVEGVVMRRRSPNARGFSRCPVEIRGN